MFFRQRKCSSETIRSKRTKQRLLLFHVLFQSDDNTEILIYKFLWFGDSTYIFPSRLQFIHPLLLPILRLAPCADSPSISLFPPLKAGSEQDLIAGNYTFTADHNTTLTAPTPPEISDEISRSVAVKEGRKTPPLSVILRNCNGF